MADPILQFFGYEHLKPQYQNVVKPFGLLAQYVVDNLPDNPQRHWSLVRLLEAKDAAVRSMVYRENV